VSLEFNKIMEPGDPVDLDVLTKENTIIRLKCNVQLVQSNVDLFISAPIYEGRIYPVETGTMLMVILSRAKAGIYTFYATVTGRSELDRVSVIHLKKSSDIKKSQRRKYFRLPFIGSIKIEDPSQPVLTEAEIRKRERLIEKFKDNPNVIIDEEPETIFIEMLGKDLSGGGFRALSRKPIELGIDITGFLMLEQLEVEFTGKVVRCRSTLEAFENYEIGVMFEGMDDNIRSQIISFIFKKQRSMRNKGLI